MKETLNNRLRYFENLKQSIGIAYLNLFVFIVLFIAEISIALVSGSKALLAAGFNNLSSIIISVGLLVGLKVSLKDPSHSHSKGYQQFETLGNLFSSFVMFLMSAYIVIEGGKGAISSFYTSPDSPGNISVIVAGGAGFVMLATFLINRKVYQKVESNSINTLMKDALSDTLMNFGTALGILLSIEINPMFDGLTAVVLGLILCRMSYLIVKENVFHLSGGFDPEMVENYQNVIEDIPGIERIVDITGKMFGDAVAVDVTIEVTGKMTVEEGAVIAETIEQELASRFDVFDVDVQVRPKR
ncbi:cation diffusion facilitator family transporter [Vagococcus carniphilus]|uniref:cation diffusion facilitator family transporter n=1 Tax=Vagococcus carniphilus TaxID=218144 RepID=UPI00288DA003|nr:cation diffusion facilitator family transporter [Vagococcus carniphilus]MDT2849189.1 cation diffusion facilitator family transporter [Vagococcus carniphilus]